MANDISKQDAAEKENLLSEVTKTDAVKKSVSDADSKPNAEQNSTSDEDSLLDAVKESMADDVTNGESETESMQGDINKLSHEAEKMTTNDNKPHSGDEKENAAEGHSDSKSTPATPSDTDQKYSQLRTVAIGSAAVAAGVTSVVAVPAMFGAAGFVGAGILAKSLAAAAMSTASGVGMAAGITAGSAGIGAAASAVVETAGTALRSSGVQGIGDWFRWLKEEDVPEGEGTEVAKEHGEAEDNDGAESGSALKPETPLNNPESTKGTIDEHTG